MNFRKFELSFFIFSFSFLSFSCPSLVVSLAFLLSVLPLIVFELPALPLEAKEEPNAPKLGTEVPEDEAAVVAGAFKLTLANGLDDDEPVVPNPENPENTPPVLPVPAELALLRFTFTIFRPASSLLHWNDH